MVHRHAPCAPARGDGALARHRNGLPVGAGPGPLALHRGGPPGRCRQRGPGSRRPGTVRRLVAHGLPPRRRSGAPLRGRRRRARAGGGQRCGGRGGDRAPGRGASHAGPALSAGGAPLFTRPRARADAGAPESARRRPGRSRARGGLGDGRGRGGTRRRPGPRAFTAHRGRGDVVHRVHRRFLRPPDGPEEPRRLHRARTRRSCLPCRRGGVERGLYAALAQSDLLAPVA